MIDQIIAAIQMVLPEKMLILLPSAEAPEIEIFYRDLRAAIDVNSVPSLFLIYSLSTGEIAGRGKGADLRQAILSACSMMRIFVTEGNDHRKAA